MTPLSLRRSTVAFVLACAAVLASACTPGDSSSGGVSGSLLPAAATPSGTSSGTSSGTATVPAGAPAGVNGGVGSVPVYAYFYQWFNPSSWNRAKQDFPLAGRYSSDDPHVLRDQVEQARGVGVDGFLTSWKRTDALNRRLDLLIQVAGSEQFDLGVVYEALDFGRHPLPIETVRADMVYLVTRWGKALTSRYYGRPVLIWTGTDAYSVADVQSVRAALGARAYLLAASKSVAGYQRVATLVDGEAYYWSSADPSAPSTTAKLVQMGQAVHANHGIWIAPAASGFDGRTLGHTRVIDRNHGLTLLQSLHDAVASKPDAVGVISWNEWSENTYIEPGERYGSQELNVLRDFLNGSATAPVPAGHDEASLLAWSGLQAAVALMLVTVLGALALAWRSRRRTATGRHSV